MLHHSIPIDTPLAVHYWVSRFLSPVIIISLIGALKRGNVESIWWELWHKKATLRKQGGFVWTVFTIRSRVARRQLRAVGS